MIAPHFKIETDLISLTFEEGGQAGFSVKHEGNKTVIHYPPQTDFASIQPWLLKVVTELLRKEAKRILPKRLEELATQHRFHYTRVSINSARTRWGSCSSKGHINLSLYLMILPQQLSDYVLLHELCHTKEMNHGPRFWKLMDQVTNGQSGTLRRTLRHYPSPFRQP